jgi:hypothetical protein
MQMIDNIIPDTLLFDKTAEDRLRDITHLQRGTNQQKAIVGTMVGFVEIF